MKKLKILVAEDDADDRFIFHNFLSERTDIDILRYVENGLEVFSFLNSMQTPDALPDVILLDHNMPKMNGRQTLEKLKQAERYADIPVFIYSTYADTQLINNCLASGAIKVVSKPLDSEGYNELMDELIGAANSIN